MNTDDFTLTHVRERTPIMTVRTRTWLAVVVVAAVLSLLPVFYTLNAPKSRESGALSGNQHVMATSGLDEAAAESLVAFVQTTYEFDVLSNQAEELGFPVEESVESLSDVDGKFVGITQAVVDAGEILPDENAAIILFNGDSGIAPTAGNVHLVAIAGIVDLDSVTLNALIKVTAIGDEDEVILEAVDAFGNNARYLLSEEFETIDLLDTNLGITSESSACAVFTSVSCIQVCAALGLLCEPPPANFVCSIVCGGLCYVLTTWACASFTANTPLTATAMSGTSTAFAMTATSVVATLQASTPVPTPTPTPNCDLPPEVCLSCSQQCWMCILCCSNPAGCPVPGFPQSDWCQGVAIWCRTSPTSTPRPTAVFTPLALPTGTAISDPKVQQACKNEGSRDCLKCFYLCMYSADVDSVACRAYLTYCEVSGLPNPGATPIQFPTWFPGPITPTPTP